MSIFILAAQMLSGIPDSYTTDAGKHEYKQLVLYIQTASTLLLYC